MNYRRLHKQLVAHARKQRRSKGGPVYYEEHHVKPVCMGGTDSPRNLVLLTAREHFLIHWMLVRIYPKNRLLAYALHAFAQTCPETRGGRSHLYKYARERFIATLKQDEQRKRKNSVTVSTMVWLHKGKHTTRVQQTEAESWLAKGYVRGRAYWVRGPHSEETRRRISKGNTGKKHSAEEIARMTAHVKSMRWISKAGKSKFVHEDTVPEWQRRGWDINKRTAYERIGKDAS